MRKICGFLTFILVVVFSNNQLTNGDLQYSLTNSNMGNPGYSTGVGGNSGYSGHSGPQFQPQQQPWGGQLKGPAGQIQQSIQKSMRDLFKGLFHPDKFNGQGQHFQIQLPDLSNISRSCGRDSFFFSMNPAHLQAIEDVKAIIMSHNTTEGRINMSMALRQSKDINPKVWYYALSGCAISDPELQGIQKPSPIQIMPDMFINAETCRKASGQPQQPQLQLAPQPGTQYGPQAVPQQGGQYGPQPVGQYGSQVPQQQGAQYGSQPVPQQQGAQYGSQTTPQQQGAQYGPIPVPQQQGAPDNHQNMPRYRRQTGQCIQLDGSVGADNGIENVLWYFREDIQLNAHHWYWHLTYPPNAQIRGDRRGELFYYMHASMLARYNAERLSNGLSRTIVFPVAQGASIEQGYFAHLADSNSGQAWTDRVANMPFTDILHQNNPNLGINIIIRDQIITARDRIQTAIDQGVINTNRGSISLRSTQGVDILGDIIQSNRFSLNQNFYGLGPAGLHNSGHVCFSEAMDPQYRTRTPPGPMADSATSMRDVIFYRWHAFVNGLFDRYKATLPAYAPNGGNMPLSWPGVEVVSVNLLPWSGGNPNQLRTFWNQIQFPFSRGLDFQRDPNSTQTNICAKHLDHGGFTYQIVVDKQNTVQGRTGTVRIFMAPRFDEQGNRFSMTAQRSMFFVLDTFTTNLNPGRNTIVRNSTTSALTVPWDQSIQEANNDANQQTPNCGCGWPQHLLLPKGKPSGMVFDLFVMITNGDQDTVQQTNPPGNCRAAPLYCGIPNARYPDARPMGYPFDRFPYQVNGAIVADLDAYRAGVLNIGTTQVTITSED